MKIYHFKKIAEYALLLSIFLIPFYFLNILIFKEKINFFEISTFLSFVFSLIYCFSTKPKTELKLGSIWTFLFTLSAGFAVFLASDKIKALGILTEWFFTPYLLYLLLINHFSKKDFPKIATILLVSAFFVSVWAFLQRFGVKYFLPTQNDVDLKNFLKISRPRVFSVFESPNYLAMFLAPVIFISLMAFNNFKNIGWKIAVSCAIVVMIVSLYWTDSRSGIIAFLSSGAFLLIKILTKKKNLFRYVLVIFMAIFVINSVYYYLKVDVHPNSERGRQKIYNYSVQMIKHHPVLGVGLGNYSNSLAYEARNDREFLVYFLPEAYHPHNLYLAIWLNLGIFGLILFVVLLAKMLINISENFDSETNIIIFSAMLTILIQGILDTTYFKNDLSAIFWLICAMSYLLKTTRNGVVYNLKFKFLGINSTIDY